MKRTHYQITYIYKGNTLTFEIWTLTSSEARETFISQCDHERMNMSKLRIIKIREIT